MFNRIDRYISGLFLGYFFGSLLVFVVIFLSIDAMGTISSYKNIAGSSLISYYLHSLPEVIYRMTSVSCLAATLFTISNLNKNNELVALFSFGTSFLRVTLPILLLVCVITVANFFISDQVLPNFTRQKNFIFYHEIKKNPSLYSLVRNERIWYRSKDMIFNLKTLNEKTRKAQGITLYSFNEAWDLIQMITAKDVDLLESNWLLKEGSVTLFTEDSSFPLTSQFKEKSITMDEDAKDLSSTANTSDSLSLSELGSFIRKNKEAGLNTLKYEVDYHSKYGFALAALVMSLLGIPFSVGKTRSGGVMLNVGICLGLIFLYWAFFSLCLSLGNHGYIPPIVAGWFPNVFTGSLAFLLILRLKK